MHFWIPSGLKPGIFFAILGRGPRAFAIGKISDVNPEFGKFSEYSKLIIYLTTLPTLPIEFLL